jgi:predicted PurR-regulated permease PerM
MAYLVEFHVITKILLTFKEKLLKKLPKIFNYQKRQKNREILPKVIKITKSGHTVVIPLYLFLSAMYLLVYTLLHIRYGIPYMVNVRDKQMFFSSFLLQTNF